MPQSDQILLNSRAKVAKLPVQIVNNPFLT